MSAQQLVKELLESRDNIVTNEVVYVAEEIDIERRGHVGYIKSYLNLELLIWVFVRWKHMPIETLAVFEFANHTPFLPSQFDSELGQDWRNDPMLVSVVDSVQDLQQTRFRPLSSMVRLKTFNSVDRLGGNAFEQLGNIPLEIGGVSVDRETSPIRFSKLLAAEQGQIIGKVVKSRPQIMGNIADYNSKLNGGLPIHLELKDLASFLRIVLADGLIWVASNERLEALAQAVYVFPCSIYLQSDAIKWLHVLDSTEPPAS